MGSVFPLDLVLLYFLTFSKPSRCLRDATMDLLPTGAHLVDPAVESIDADVSPEPAKQQQQPTTTTC